MLDTDDRCFFLLLRFKGNLPKLPHDEHVILTTSPMFPETKKIVLHLGH